MQLPTNLCLPNNTGFERKIAVKSQTNVRNDVRNGQHQKNLSPSFKGYDAFPHTQRLALEEMDYWENESFRDIREEERHIREMARRNDQSEHVIWDMGTLRWEIQNAHSMSALKKLKASLAGMPSFVKSEYERKEQELQPKPKAESKPARKKEGLSADSRITVNSEGQLIESVYKNRKEYIYKVNTLYDKRGHIRGYERGKLLEVR